MPEKEVKQLVPTGPIVQEPVVPARKPNQKPLLAPSGKVRILLYRIAGDVPVVIGRKDANALQQTFYFKRGREIHGFELDLERVSFVAKVGVWLGMRSEPRPYLWYDMDKAEAVLMTFNGVSRYVQLHKATDVKNEFVPSSMIGLIKKYEMYGQVARAHMKQQGTLNAMAIIFLILGIAIGFFAGAAFAPSITKAAQPVVNGTKTIIQTFLL